MFADQRALLLTAAACSKPDQGVFGELLKPLQADIEAIMKAKETNRKERDWANHFMVVAEGAPVVGWVTVVRCPDCLDSVMYVFNHAHAEPETRTTCEGGCRVDAVLC
jgi:hypothetical protein